MYLYIFLLLSLSDAAYTYNWDTCIYSYNAEKYLCDLGSIPLFEGQCFVDGIGNHLCMCQVEANIQPGSSWSCSRHGDCHSSTDYQLTQYYAPTQHPYFSPFTLCTCEPGFRGAKCEQVAPVDIPATPGHPAIPALSYTNWPYSLPNLRFDISPSALTPLHIQQASSLEYGFHNTYNMYKYSDYYLLDHPDDQPQLTPAQFMFVFRNRVTRRVSSVKFNYEMDYHVIAHKGPDYPSSNCPPGMRKYTKSGPADDRFGNDATVPYYCGCIPGAESVGCSGKGRCVMARLYILYYNGVPNFSDLRIDNIESVYNEWATRSPIHVSVIGGLPLFINEKEKFMTIPYSWYTSSDVVSGTEHPMCLCDDHSDGYWCETDISRGTVCSGHGDWDGQKCTCDSSSGWSGDAHCDIPNYDKFYCHDNGHWDSTHQRCHCNVDNKWGTNCTLDCDKTLCNGRGTCVPNSVLSDGLFPGFTLPRYSHKCVCDPLPNGLVATGNHCTVVSPLNVECDGNGVARDTTVLDGESLSDKYCDGSAGTNGIAVFNEQTGRTVAPCPYWSFRDNYAVTTGDLSGHGYTCGAPERGTCIAPGPLDPLANSVCRCNNGFGPPEEGCGKRRCRAVNGGAVCNGHGTCNVSNNRCECETGYVGDACEQYDSGDDCGENSVHV